MSAPTVFIIANPYEAEVARRVVEGMGLRPVVSDGGDGTLAQFEAESPSLVVLSLGLYAGDSAELLAALRPPGRMRVPLVVIADPDTDDAEIEAARRADVDRWVLRPIETGVLRHHLTELTEGEGWEEAEEARARMDEALEVAVGQVYEELAHDEGDEAASGSEDEEFRHLARVVQYAERGATEVIAVAPQLPAERAAPLGEAQVRSAALGGGEVSPAREERRGAGPSVERWTRRAEESASGPLPATPRLTPSGPGLASAQIRRVTRRSPAPMDDTLGGDIDLDLLGVDALPDIDDAELAEERAQRPTPAKEPPKKRGEELADLGIPGDSPLGRLAADRLAPATGRPSPVPVLREPPSTPPLAPPEERGPPAPELPESGELGATTLAALVARLHLAGFSGRLGLSRDSGARALYFDGGLVVGATSSLPQDGLGELLWREGRVTRADLGRGRSALSEPGGELASVRLGEALIGLGLLGEEELPAVLGRHAEELVYAAFTWEDARYQLGPEVVPPELRLRLGHPYALVAEGVRRKLGLDRLMEHVGPPTTRLEATPMLEAVAEAAGLETAERTVVMALESAPRAVNELVSLARLGEHAGYALAFTLLELGAVRAERGVRPQRVGDRERILAKLSVVNDGDYFAVLGVGRDATGYEIRRAWELARREFSSERLAPELRAELGAPLAEIAEVIDEAYRLLSDERMRESYRAHLPA